MGDCVAKIKTVLCIDGNEESQVLYFPLTPVATYVNDIVMTKGYDKGIVDVDKSGNIEIIRENFCVYRIEDIKLKKFVRLRIPSYINEKHCVRLLGTNCVVVSTDDRHFIYQFDLFKSTITLLKECTHTGKFNKHRRGFEVVSVTLDSTIFLGEGKLFFFDRNMDICLYTASTESWTVILQGVTEFVQDEFFSFFTSDRICISFSANMKHVVAHKKIEKSEEHALLVLTLTPNTDTVNSCYKFPPFKDAIVQCDMSTKVANFSTSDALELCVMPDDLNLKVYLCTQHDIRTIQLNNKNLKESFKVNFDGKITSVGFQLIRSCSEQFWNNIYNGSPAKHMFIGNLQKLPKKAFDLFVKMSVFGFVPFN